MPVRAVLHLTQDDEAIEKPARDGNDDEAEEDEQDARYALGLDGVYMKSPFLLSPAFVASAVSTWPFLHPWFLVRPTIIFIKRGSTFCKRQGTIM